MDQFSYETNGYNREEVRNFVSMVISQTEDIIRKCDEQSREIERLKLELERYKNLESAIQDRLLKAEKDSDELRQSARDERDKIIEDAKSNANVIVNEALTRAKKIENSSLLLEDNMKIFKSKLKLLVEQQMDIVDEIEILELEP